MKKAKAVRELEFAPCPMCGQLSLYVAQLDRYVHINGSSNHDCWLRFLRGEKGTKA